MRAWIAPGVQEELEPNTIRCSEEPIPSSPNQSLKCPQFIIIPRFPSLYASLAFLDTSYPPQNTHQTAAYTSTLYQPTTLPCNSAATPMSDLSAVP
jgi:hypothetical protein